MTGGGYPYGDWCGTCQHLCKDGDEEPCNGCVPSGWQAQHDEREMLRDRIDALENQLLLFGGRP